MSKEPSFIINWQYSGKPDALFGTGATRTEKALVWLASILAAAVYIYLSFTDALDWTGWQYLVAAFIAFDVGGGVVANSLNSCKRFYHAPLQDSETGYLRIAKHHFAFSAFHIHPIVIGLLYDQGWGYGIFWYSLLLLSTVWVLKTPLYLQRPIAMLIIMLALGINLYGIPAIEGLEWFIPALFLKIIYGHLVREEPYRPADNGNNR